MLKADSTVAFFFFNFYFNFFYLSYRSCNLLAFVRKMETMVYEQPASAEKGE